MTVAFPPQMIRRSLRGGRIREIIGFFGAGPHRMFGVTHLPAGTARAGLVICSSIGPEQLTGYRNEVRLAREVAATGVAVQRFHYRGTGHSDGEEADVYVRDDEIVPENFGTLGAIAAYIERRRGR